MTLFTISQDYLCYLSPENDPGSFLKGDQLDMVRARETDSYREAPLWFYQRYYAMLEVKTRIQTQQRYLAISFRPRVCGKTIQKVSLDVYLPSSRW